MKILNSAVCDSFFKKYFFRKKFQENTEFSNIHTSQPICCLMAELTYETFSSSKKDRQFTLPDLHLGQAKSIQIFNISGQKLT